MSVNGSTARYRSHERARVGQRFRNELLTLGRPPGKCKLEDEELVEGEAPPADLGLLQRARPVQGDERIGPQWQPLGGRKPGRQRIALCARELERRPHERTQLLLGERLAGRVDGRVVGGLGHLAEVVALHLEPVAVGLPAQADTGAGRQLRLEPGLVEPRRLDLTGVVGDPGREDPQSAPAAP